MAVTEERIWLALNGGISALLYTDQVYSAAVKNPVVTLMGTR